jgi:uncharacterized protein YdeI (YjbR/CyaY-like superfamily)
VSAADYPTIQPKSLAEWRRWLRRSHANAPGVWIQWPKRGVGSPDLPYASAVEEALCYGWIDGQYKPIDGRSSKLLFTPRRAGSLWARSNRERVVRLITAGRMRSAGLAKIEAAKRDGSWSLLESVDAVRVPRDLRDALRAARLTRAWSALSTSGKQTHLRALVTAKRPETRVKRVAAVVRALGE